MIDGALGVVNTKTVTGLATGSTYRYKLIATNAVGDSVNSAQSAGIIAAVKPDPPTSLARVYSDASMITIQWSAPSDNGGTPVTDYHVVWDYGSGGASFVQIAATTAGTL